GIIPGAPKARQPMKAIQVKQPGGPEALEFVDLPIPQPKSREAVVKIAASGVNFIDVNLREGRYKVPLPFVVGQEAAGVVSSVGSEVKLVRARGRWRSRASAGADGAPTRRESDRHGFYGRESPASAAGGRR